MNTEQREAIYQRPNSRLLVRDGNHGQLPRDDVERVSRFRFLNGVSAPPKKLRKQTWRQIFK